MERLEFMKKCDEVQKYWGNRMPMMVMEEAGELIQSISKYERQRDDVFPDVAEQDLIDEMGDMYISLYALMVQYSEYIDDLEDKIKERIEAKLNKHY